MGSGSVVSLPMGWKSFTDGGSHGCTEHQNVLFHCQYTAQILSLVLRETHVLNAIMELHQVDS